MMGGMFGGYGGMMGGYGGWAMGLVWFILQIAIVIGVIYFLIYLVRGFVSSHRHPGQAKRAMEILEERFVKGEITEEEFKQMKKALNG